MSISDCCTSLENPMEQIQAWHRSSTFCPNCPPQAVGGVQVQVDDVFLYVLSIMYNSLWAYPKVIWGCWQDFRHHVPQNLRIFRIQFELMERRRGWLTRKCARRTSPCILILSGCVVTNMLGLNRLMEAWTTRLSATRCYKRTAGSPGAGLCLLAIYILTGGQDPGFAQVVSSVLVRASLKGRRSSPEVCSGCRTPVRTFVLTSVEANCR